MVETDFRPEERAPDEPDPDDPGLFIPDGSEGLPVVDENGRRMGELTDGYVMGGSVERLVIRVDEELRRARNLPEKLDLDVNWTDRRENDLQLIMDVDEILDRLGFETP